MKRHNKVSTNINSWSMNRRVAKGTAIQLSHDIKLASWLGKHALTERGRNRAYQVKAAKLSQALTHFDRYFCILWVERHNPKFDYLLTARLADMSLVHIPLQHLSVEAQSAINLSSLYVRRVPLQVRAASVASFADTTSVNLHHLCVA
jgi:hypothetical protein